MANENYDELVKQARRQKTLLVHELADAVEELQPQLARAEQRIADLRKDLSRHEHCSVDQISVSSAQVVACLARDEAAAKETK